ncbi:MAG: dihydrofolate reductase family protein [Candidatus Thiodiazotropha sp. DIVDIV]
MTSYVYIAQSLDGYIAGPNGELDWLDEIDNPEQSDFGFSAYMSNIDALIMGRKTYEKVLSFGMWPYDKPVFVASNSLCELPVVADGKAFLLSGTPKEMVRSLNERGCFNLYVDGGSLIQSFLIANLIDKIIITTVPVILGGGITLFGKMPRRFKLNHLDTEVLINQLVKTSYDVEKE